MSDSSPGENIGKFILNLYYGETPSDQFPPYIMLYANHVQFFTEQNSTVFEPLFGNHNLIELMRQFSDKIIFDASLWNYKFELASGYPLELDKNKSPISDLLIDAHHGDGRNFHYNLFVEQASIFDVNDLENFQLVFNAPDAFPPPSPHATSIVHVTMRISSDAGIPLVNSENLLLLSNVEVDLTSSEEMVPPYPQKAKLSGYIDLRNEPFAMSLTIIQERDSIVPPSETE